MKTKLELEALGFTGFYQGIWDQGENEYGAMQMLKYGDYDDIETLEFIEYWGFGEDYREKVMKEYAERYVAFVNDVLGTNFTLTFQSLWSPKEYNFQTDKVFCDVEIEDFDGLVDRLVKMVSTDLDLYNVMRKTIHENHTSCSGFISFMDNDIDEWFGLIQGPENTTYISYFIAYLVNAIQPGSLRQLNEDIYGYVSENTDWHLPVPETDEAKEEHQLYSEHRDTYTEFLKEYRKNHVDPTRHDWPEDNRRRYDVDWDEFKEAFSEHLEFLEAERKRLEYLRNQPVIPGLE